MSTKNSRSGGKYCGSHTTVIPAAAVVLDKIQSLPGIKQITLGYIKAGLKSVNGQRRVKLSDCNGGLHLAVRDNTTHQEIKAYYEDGRNPQDVKLEVARVVRNVGLHLSFGQHSG